MHVYQYGKGFKIAMKGLNGGRINIGREKGKLVSIVGVTGLLGLNCIMYFQNAGACMHRLST